MFFKPKSVPVLVHPSQDGTCRFFDDQRLRKHGFVIHSRPKNGPTLWSYGKDIYDQDEALDLIGDMEEAEIK